MFNLWIEFIKYCLDDRPTLPEDIKNMDWAGLFQFCQEQTIAGVIFNDDRWEQDDIRPPKEVLLQWIALNEQIKGRNRLLNKRSIEVVKEYQDAGFQCCLLKGQGNAMMYPNPLCRTPGDIDLWTDAQKNDILKYVMKHHPQNLQLRYYHIGYLDKGVEIEAHFMPNIMNNPVYHRRLQKWFIERQSEQCQNMIVLPEGVGAISAPTVEFNIIFQLSHMMHHFFDEGIGLRQMMDYYFVLKARNTDSGNQGNTELGKTLRYLGLWKFAGAVMYVMQEVFALDKTYLIAPVDERRGKTLLAEILKGGNFGKYSGLTKHSTGWKYFAKTWRNLKLVHEYPAEAICEPFFRTWHFFWRMRYN